MWSKADGTNNFEQTTLQSCVRERDCTQTIIRNWALSSTVKKEIKTINLWAIFRLKNVVGALDCQFIAMEQAKMRKTI